MLNFTHISEKTIQEKNRINREMKTIKVREKKKGKKKRDMQKMWH